MEQSEKHSSVPFNAPFSLDRQRQEFVIVPGPGIASAIDQTDQKKYDRTHVIECLDRAKD
jgi:hypothetical protein